MGAGADVYMDSVRMRVRVRDPSQIRTCMAHYLDLHLQAGPYYYHGHPPLYVLTFTRIPWRFVLIFGDILDKPTLIKGRGVCRDHAAIFCAQQGPRCINTDFMVD